MICIRHHTFYNQKYQIFLNDSHFQIGKSQNNIKYSFRLSIRIVLKWNIQCDLTLNGFEIYVNNTLKKFHMSHMDTLELMQQLSGKVLYQNIHSSYRIISQIGSGSFSKVMKVFNINTCEYEACKLIQKSTFWDFENEIQIMRSLNHDNFPKLKAIYLEKSGFCVFTELAEGGTLKQYLQFRDSIPKQDVYTIMKQLLSALEYLHNLGLVHRDIKPDNILLKRKNNIDQLYLIDFGLASKLDEVSSRYPSCGTPGYIAPEVINFDPIKTYDQVSDIFSCGVLLYKLIYGKDLFSGSEYTDIVVQNREFQVDYGDFEINEFNDLLKGMLNENPDDRLNATEALLKLESLYYKGFQFQDESFTLPQSQTIIQEVKFFSTKLTQRNEKISL